MNTLLFKTNINCANCVRNISSTLNEVVGIDKWTVDTQNADKILTVTGDEITADTIVNAVEDAGFDIELIQR